MISDLVFLSENRDESRATSWFEFLLDPTKLDNHLDDLLANKVKNPSGIDLLKVFLKQAQQSVNQPKGGKKRALLNSFAIKTATRLDYTLDDLEAHLPVKFQRNLLLELSNSSQSPAQIFLFRWIIRTAIKQQERPWVFEPPSEIPDPKERFNFEFKIALEKLENFLKEQKQINPTSVAMMAQINFELAEFHFIHERYDQAKSFFSESQKAFFSNLKSSNKHCTLDVKKLNGYLVACTAMLSGSLEVDKTLLDKSIPYFLHSAEVSRSANDPSKSGIIEILLKDNLLLGSSSLPTAYRDNLSSQLSSIRKEIILCNLLKSVVHKEPINYAFIRTQESLGISQIKTLIDYAVSTISLYASIDRSIRLSLPENILKERIRNFLRQVCEISEETEIWKYFLSKGKEFSTNEDIQRFSNFENVKKEEKEVIEHIRKKLKSEENHNLSSDEIYRSFWLPISTETFITSCKENQFKMEDQSILKKADHLFRSGNLSQAKQFYEMIHHIPQAAYSSAIVDIVRFSKDESKWENLGAHFFELLSKYGIPDLGILETIVTFYANTFQLDAMKKYSSEVKTIVDAVKPKNAPNFHLLCDFSIHFSELLKVSNKYISNRETMPIEEQKELGRQIEPIFDKTLSFLLKSPSKEKDKVIQLTIEWNSTTGVLRKLGNVPSSSQNDSLQIFVALLAGALYHIRKAKKMPAFHDPFIDRYGPLSQLSGGANFFTKSSNVGIPFESQILDVFTNTLERLNAIYPSESKWVYGMGDSLFDRLELQSKDAFKFREVARHYLYGGAMETSYFTSKMKIPRSFYTVIKRLMTSLHQSKANLPAAILCQFMPNVDYAMTFKLLTENPALLDPLYFQFVWEMPLLEVLMATFSRLQDEKKANLLSYFISLPELNEHNPQSLRELLIDNLKMNFLKCLFKEFVYS